MITLVVGPPGAGKGLWLIQVVRDILLDTNQTVVTQFAIKLPELNAWFQKHHPEKSIDLHQRIRFLEYDEIKRFYLIRGPGRELKGVTTEEEKRNVFPDYERAKDWPPICYILDEADIHFGAREYAEHGRSVNYYNKQHRKLSDTVYYCCQTVEQLDKQIRQLAQQTVVLKNLGKQKKGIFRLPAAFVWSSHYQLPKPQAQPMASGFFRLNIDHGLQECFETAAGVGMAGMKADRDEKQKGVALWWVIPAIILGGILLVKFPMFMAKGLSMATVGASKKAVEAYRGTNGLFAAESMAATNELAVAQAVVRAPTTTNLPNAAPTEAAPVYLTGMTVLRGKASVYLSDGRVVTSEDKELEIIAPARFVVIEGKRYDFSLIARAKGRPAPQIGSGMEASGSR